MHILNNEPPWRPGVLHRLAIELFWLVELQSEIDQTERWDDAQAKADPPRRAQMAVGAGQDHNHGHQARGDEADVDLDVCEHDEPSVSMSFLQLPGAFGAGDTSSRIFTTT